MISMGVFSLVVKADEENGKVGTAVGKHFYTILIMVYILIVRLH